MRDPQSSEDRATGDLTGDADRAITTHAQLHAAGVDLRFGDDLLIGWPEVWLGAQLRCDPLEQEATRKAAPATMVRGVQPVEATDVLRTRCTAQVPDGQLAADCKCDGA